MAKQISVRFSYFGYTASFDVDAGSSTADSRAEANRRIIEAYGNPTSTALRYVEPGVPFPDYVPCMVWDGEDGDYF